MDTNGVDKVSSKKNGFHKGPMELYLVRISPACRAVWLYVIQVNDVISYELVCNFCELNVKKLYTLRFFLNDV